MTCYHCKPRVLSQVSSFLSTASITCSVLSATPERSIAAAHWDNVGEACHQTHDLSIMNPSGPQDS